MFVLSLLAVAGKFPTYFVAVYVVGLVAAVSIGLVAWYNSKRPVGWERSRRPSFIPKVNTGDDGEPPQFTPSETTVEPESPSKSVEGTEEEDSKSAMADAASE
ncbi:MULTISPECIES: photosystem II assembly protein Psb35 [unclassified Synechocystis]|uniref:photosystem II assembly protein Psb35 n=1 Tax=unclassified Synechocystis TaxID=2640012 RepID=UPI0004048DD3|nr:MULTISPECIES: hypothetical protein [unclassified Synechocystis]AIE72609.1 hypothetical protein D082_00800 [Synechocystis sp. PCC 6714]